MVILKGILLTLLAVSACVLMLAVAAGVILDIADSAKSLEEKRRLREENEQLEKMLDNELKVNEAMFQQIRKMRRMP